MVLGGLIVSCERGNPVLQAVPCQPLHQPPPPAHRVGADREFFIENLLVQIRFIIVMIQWTGLGPWEFAFPFPGSLTITLLRVGANPLCQAP